MPNIDYLREHPEYIEILKWIVEFEDQNAPMESPILENKPYDAMWKNTKPPFHPSKVYQLEANGFIERVYDSNKHTDYALVDREEAKQILEDIGDMSNGDGTFKKMHDFPSEEELPDDIFDDVIGYDDIKWLFKRALTTQEITNILLVGPSGSAKTVFLMAINDLDDAVFMSGSPSSGPGVLDTMFKKKPKYMLIDEMDDMDNGVQDVLSQYTETGIVDETKMGKDRKLKTNTKTFCSANEMDDIIGQMADRFLDLHFEPYTKKEYVEVCEHILPRNENCTEEEALEIARGVWELEGEGDVRKAIQVARLSRGDPDKVIGVLGDYSPTKLAEKF